MQDEIERAKELLREAYAILTKFDKPNIRDDLTLLALRPDPGPVVSIPPIRPEPPELDE